MRYFSSLPSPRAASLFHRKPNEFFRDSTPGRLAMALGATLYSPAVRPHLAEDIARCHRLGVMSMVCCLEDAICDDEVEAAEANLARELRRHHEAAQDGPLLFVRVRCLDQISRLVGRLGDALAVLSGFVLPKFRADTAGRAAIETIKKIGADAGQPMYVMPVLETPEVAAVEGRVDALHDIHEVLDSHRDAVLAVRIGGTDLCGLYGLRRPVELTVWDVAVVAAMLADIVNVIGRRDGLGFPLTGPVWEYFSAGGRARTPHLRRSLDGLIRETVLDRANGLMGKTIIHPSHAAVVHSLSVVSHEEFTDAASILTGADSFSGGVLRSTYENKMNEIGPHRAWAELTLQRADIFGVAAETVTFMDLLEAHEPDGSRQ